MKPLNKNLEEVKESIFSVITRKAIEYNATNLAQGFPSFDGPSWMKEIAKNAISIGPNQYGPAHGDEKLRSGISKYYKDLYDFQVDKDSEITIAVGASEPLFNSIFSLINPGDEVILLGPAYNLYPPVINLAGGVVKEVSLQPPQFKLSKGLLESAITDKTKCIILNNPNNPTGKVFSKQELEMIRDICVDNDLYAISDEVYEFLTYDESVHLPLSTIEGMKERTILVSSASKTFSFTGWRIGWSIAPTNLTEVIRKIHQFNSFNACVPLQRALGEIILKNDGNDFYDYLKTYKIEYAKRKKTIESELENLNIPFYKPQGSFFLLTPADKMMQKLDCSNDNELVFKLIEKYKLALIPASSFYLQNKIDIPCVRFCFAKDTEKLNSIRNLKALFDK